MAELGSWVAIITGWISLVSLLVFLGSIPTRDKRFTTGFKDHALAPGCLAPTVALVTGLISYYTNEMAFLEHLLSLVMKYVQLLNSDW